MYSVFRVSVTFAAKTSALYLCEMSNHHPFRTSFAVEWKIVQDASEFSASDKFHVQFLA